MKRRKLLRGLGIGAAAWPAFISRAFAAEPEESAPSAAAFDGYRRAARAGKPLLVFVIPEDLRQRYTRGEIFGELINYAQDRALAPLALSEVVCATVKDVAKLTGARIEGEPLFIVVETDALPARVVPLTVSLPQAQPLSPQEISLAKDDWRKLGAERNRRENVASDLRIAAMAGLLRSALMGDAALVSRRAAQAREALGSDAPAIDRVLSAQRMPAQVSAAAALIAEAANDEDARTSEIYLGALAGEAVARVRHASPKGAHWAQAGNCGGPEIEGYVRVGSDGVYTCGMGHVPERGRRMLYFFTLGKEWRKADAK